MVVVRSGSSNRVSLPGWGRYLRRNLLKRIFLGAAILLVIMQRMMIDQYHQLQQQVQFSKTFNEAFTYERRQTDTFPSNNPVAVDQKISAQLQQSNKSKSYPESPKKGELRMKPQVLGQKNQVQRTINKPEPAFPAIPSQLEDLASSSYNVTTLYDQTPDLSTFPEWIQTYVKWHQDVRKKYPGMKLFTDPQAPKVLVRLCLGRCGGLHDRLGQLPWDLYLANQTGRVLLMGWYCPMALEEFMVPNVLDWSIPDEVAWNGVCTDVHTDATHESKVKNIPKFFEGYSEVNPNQLFWKTELDICIERANTGEYKDEKVLRHILLGHVAEEELEQRLAALGQTPKIHEAPIFGALFWLFFKPSPPVDLQFRRSLSSVQLEPNYYSAVHCRVRHPKAFPQNSSLHRLADRLDRNGLPWKGEARSFALDTATRALSCSMNISQDPIYFLSDSSDLAQHVAVDLKNQSWLRQYPGMIDPSLQSVVNHSQGVFSREVSEANFHIDRQKKHKTTEYYGTFLDLLFVVHAKCVTYGIGYYAVFATKISGTECKLIYQEEEWGKSGGSVKAKKTPVCTDDMWYHKPVA